MERVAFFALLLCSGTCFDSVVVGLAGSVVSGGHVVKGGSAGNGIEPGIFVLGWVDDVFPAVKSQLIAQFHSPVPTLDHGLHLGRRRKECTRVIKNCLQCAASWP